MPNRDLDDLNAPVDDGWGSDDELRAAEAMLAMPLPDGIDPITPGSSQDEDDDEDESFDGFTPFTVFQRARSIFITAMDYMELSLHQWHGRVIPNSRSAAIATIEEDVQRMGQLLLSLAEQHDFLDLQLALNALMGAVARLQGDLAILLPVHSVQRPAGPGETEWRDLLRSIMLGYLRGECFGTR